MPRTSSSIPSTLLAFALLSCLAVPPSTRAAEPTPQPTKATPVLISGVYFHGYLPGTPGADTAVRLVNTDPDRPALLTGFALSDQFTPRKQRKGKSDRDDLFEEAEPDLGGDEPAKPTRGRPKGNRVLRFPDGAQIPPGGEIWVAASAVGFRMAFGESPAFEATNADPKVPDLDPPNGFLWLNEGYGTVALVDRRGYAVDFVAWQGPKQDMFKDGAFDDVPWSGGPVAIKENTIYGWTGRVLARARDTAGKVLPDTDRPADWPVGFSQTTLGTRPTHRVELAGQSHFVSRPLTNVRAKVLATSAPDNNYAALIAAFDAAKRDLRVRVYELTNPKIADALIKTKKRGVDVKVFLEGSPVGGISDQSRWLTDKLFKAKIPVHYLATPKGSPLAPRYRYDHSKYVLVDDRLCVIGTENYGRTGVPVVNTFGNRGWMVHVENPAFVRQLRDVWDHDYRPSEMIDTLSIDFAPDDSYGLPYRDPAFTPSDKIPSGLYPSPVKPVQVDDVMNLELVLSPDTSLNEESAIIGMINRAKTSLILEQNSVLPFWSKKSKKGDKNAKDDKDDKDDEVVRIPSLPLQAVIAAARRGVKVRVLLDGTWYNAESVDERDNDDTVRLLNDLRTNEGLDVSAKVINLQSTHLEKIHAKGVIVDDREVFIGSINWSENSFEGNREVGVIVTHPKIAGYYADLFRRDWSQSRLYASTLASAVEVRADPDDKAKAVAKKKAGERVEIVDERPGPDGKLAWVEVALGLGPTGFIPAAALGIPEVTAWETQYVVGRNVIATATVEGVRPGDKVTQLQFADPDRPPFVAVIFKKDEAKWTSAGLDPATAYLHKEVRMRGKVIVYKVPEIILNDPKQIEIIP
jgi:phosphatidylserine/phosphatidylglycerophosphate/cardiolipin synthase-like enzyme